VSDCDAADVGQDGFLSVSRNIGEFHRDRDGDTFRGWLRTITRNKIRDFHRDRGEDRAAGGDRALNWLHQLPDSPAANSDADERGVLYARALELIRRDYEEQNWQAFWRMVVA